MKAEVQERQARLRWIAVAAGIVAVGIAGYLGFVVFVEAGASGGVGAGVLGLAAATGFAAFFSPCSFPLLLTFLTRQYEAGSRRGIGLTTLMVSLGAAVFFALVAVLLVVSNEALSGSVGFDSRAGRAFRGVLGVFLLVLGLRQARLITLRIRAFDRIATAAARAFNPAKATTPVARDFVYGFGYVLAGFG